MRMIDMPLVEQEQQHLTKAEGYLELGMFLDANEELENIEPDVRHLPEVLLVRLGIYHGLKKWELMQAVAKKLTKHDAANAQLWILWAYATRRAESIEAARDILLEALTHHPEVAVFHFNLACYECQLGNMDVARGYVTKTFKIEPGYKLLALEDDDLKPLWDSLMHSDEP
jgi:tetratricopeptide (TPR) repeat protein